MSQVRVHYVSQSGRERLQAALSAAIEAHQEICRQRQLAFELSGDGWHDNPHFNHLQQLEANSTHRIADLRNVLARTQIVEVADGQRPIDRARLGSIAHIEVADRATGQITTRVIEIVGFQEGNAAGGRVSYDAPLAKALLGRRAGDVVETTLPSGRVEIVLVELFESEDDAQSIGR